MHRSHRLTAVLFAFLTLAPVAVQAQDALPPPDAVAPQAFSPAQIEQLVAPVALYPDQMLGQVLMASTYPLELVEASRWRQEPGNANLQGDQLAAALEQQPWDPSVKSLVQFPQVLSMMDHNLEWTEQLGNAFLAQQADVGNAVQNLRARAQSTGNLTSSPQETVAGGPGAIEIMPAQPDIVYVPTYNPQVAYGAWPYPGYPPYYFPPPPGYYYSAPGIIAFGVGIGVLDLFWDWDRWDWQHRRIDIDDRRFEEINRGHSPLVHGEWEHNPYHRHGVPYNNPTVREHFNSSTAAAHANYRGYDASHRVVPLTGAMMPPQQSRNASPERSDDHSHWQHMGNPPQAHENAQPQLQNRETPRTEFHNQVMQTPVVTTAPSPAQTERREFHPQAQPRPNMQPTIQVQPQQRSAPVFESFSRGPDVRAQSQRGSFSRSTMPRPEVHQVPQSQVQHAAPVAPQHAAPAGGGGHDDHGGNGSGRDDHNRNH